MNRTLVLVGGAILLFGAGAVVFVTLLPGGGGTDAPAPQLPVVPPSEVNLGPAPGVIPPRPAWAPTGPVEIPAYGPARPEAPQGTWEAIPPAARAAGLGRIGGGVGRELNEIRPDLDTCFDEDTQARHGQSAVSRTQDYAPMDDAGTTVLMLHLETQYDGVRIVDAPVEVQGSASDGLVACAQRVLRGRVLQVPGARPGSRHRLVFPLTQ